MMDLRDCCPFCTDNISVNSLPESVHVLVNHRIAIQDSVQAVKDHYIRLLEPWADQRRFKLNAFGSVFPPKRPMPRPRDDVEEGTLILEAQYELDSSPVSDAEDDRFGWLVGTLRGVFGDDVVVAPELLTGKPCQFRDDRSQSLT
jgi:Gly-Xaa carboxypeptidase